MSTPPVPPTLLARYRVVDKLGAGGMGVVYRAEDLATGRVVALKLLALADPDGSAAQRFAREGRAAMRVRHPNVAATELAGVADGVPFLVLEYLPGGSLSDRLRRTGRLPWRDAARIGAAVARGLAAIHAAGLIHRDVKPANVLLDASGQPRVTDFGLARAEVSGSSLGTLTKAGEVVGTAEWISPEQADGQPADARSDLYAFGCVLHALLAGDPPFPGSGFEVLKRHLLDTPASCSDLVPEVPGELSALVLRLLAKEPRERGPGAAEVALELEALAGAETRGARSRAPAVLVAVLAGGGLLAAGTLAARAGRARDPGVAAGTSASVGTVPSAASGSGMGGGPGVRDALADPPFLARWKQTVRGALAFGEAWGSPRWKLGCSAASVAILPDGRRVATGCWAPGGLAIHDLETGEELARFQAAQSITALAFDGPRLIVVAQGGVAVRDAGRPDVPELPDSIALPVTGLDQQVAVAGGRVLVLDRTSMTLRASSKEEADPAWSRSAVIGVAASGDGRRVAVASVASNVVSILDAATLEAAPGLVPRVAEEGVPSRLALSQDGALLLGGSDGDGILRLWSLAPGAPALPVARGDQGGPGVASVAFAPDGKTAASGGLDGSLAFWRVAPGRLELGSRLVPHALAVMALSFSPDGSRLATASRDGTLRAFDVASGRETSSVEGHAFKVTSLALARAGARVVSTGAEGTAALWDLATKTTPEVRLGDEGGRAAAIDASGTRVLLAGESGKVREWRWPASGGLELDRALDLPGGAEAVAVSPDGRRGFAALGRRAYVWDRDGPPRQEGPEELEARWIATPTPDEFVVAAASSVFFFRWSHDSAARNPWTTPVNVSALAAASDGARICVGLDGGEVGWLDLREGPARRGTSPETSPPLSDIVRPPKRSSVSALAVSPNGRVVLAGHEDGTLRLLRAGARRARTEEGATLSPDHATAAVFLDDRTALVGTVRGIVVRVTVGEPGGR